MARGLEGRTAVVTGASRGIGAAIATALAGEGARVALLARSRDALEAIAQRIGSGAFAIAADLSTPASARKAADAATRKFGGAPDILVNNAGVFRIEEMHEADADEFSRMTGINLVAPFALIRAFLPAMRERRSGHVVTIGSTADRHIYAGNAAYSATKFGARAIHEVLREETRGSGVRATLVAPAGVDTDIWESIRFPGADAPPDRESMMPPAAVADAVLFAVTRPAGINIDELRLSSS